MQDEFIVIYDGICNLCNWAVNFIIKRDKRNSFKFASFQSDFVSRQFPKSKNILTKSNTVIFFDGNKIYQKSEAVLEILNKLDSPLKYLFILKFLPVPFRDFIYDLIANNRYKWFGKKDKCIIPSKEIINKFLF